MTLDCIRSVFEQTKSISVEIILVDNASKDASVETIRQRFPTVIIKENDENKLFPVANNEAIPLASGRYVLLLNSDTVVLDRALEKMVAFMDANPTAGICGAKMYDANMRPWRYETWRPTAVRYLIQPLLMRFLGDVQSSRVAWVCGACLMIRREVFEDIGLLDEFMYGEDMDWCVRTHDAGWDVWHLDDARIIHYWGVTGTTPEKIAWRIFAGRRSKVYYISKFNGSVDGFLIRIVLAFEATVKIAAYTAQLPWLAPERRSYRSAQVAGYRMLWKALFTGRILNSVPAW
jgi:GT2 family glycosyltransferase